MRQETESDAAPPEPEPSPLDGFTPEELDTLKQLAKVLARLQDACGLTAFASGILTMIAVCGGLIGVTEFSDPAERIPAILGLAASPAFAISAWALMAKARSLVKSLRQGSDVLMHRLRRTVLVSLLPALAGALGVALAAWTAAEGEFAGLAVLMFYGGVYSIGMAVTPSMAMWTMLRFGGFISMALHTPLPRRLGREDALDEFIADATRRGPKRTKKRARPSRRARP